jgi:hypothetical protein
MKPMSHLCFSELNKCDIQMAQGHRKTNFVEKMSLPRKKRKKGIELMPDQTLVDFFYFLPNGKIPDQTQINSCYSYMSQVTLLLIRNL